MNRPPSSDSTGAQTGNDLSARSARRHGRRPKFEKVQFFVSLFVSYVIARL